MKNKRVKLNDRVGTVVGNPYRFFNNGQWDRYVEVMFDDSGYIEAVLKESVEVI